jgi:hypothetical protein
VCGVHHLWKSWARSIPSSNNNKVKSHGIRTEILGIEQCCPTFLYILERIWPMAVEARAPCGDRNNNNNKVILIKITTDFIFMTVFPEIFWSSHEIILIGKCAWGWIEWKQIYDTLTIIVTGPSKQSRLRYVMCLKGCLEMPALSPVKKESVG